MPNAQLSFVLLWKRVVAALSLVAAALLASMAAAPAGSSGMVGSRAGQAGPVATAPSALIATLDGIVEDAQRASPPQDAGGAKGKALAPAARPAPAVSRPVVATAAPAEREQPGRHASRAGLTRAPPGA
jgi:hypothetical protein